MNWICVSSFSLLPKRKGSKGESGGLISNEKQSEALTNVRYWIGKLEPLVILPGLSSVCQ